MIISNLTRELRIYLKETDLSLFFVVAIISLLSITNMYGIAGMESPFFKKQIIFTIIGLGVMTVFSFFNYRYLKDYSIFVLALYAISLILLGLTFYFSSIRGTNSWIIFGDLTFEPAELAKLSLIILMAKYFSQRHVHIYQLKHILASGSYFILPTVFMINQPDLGSVIILLLIWGGMLIAAGINRKQLFLLILVGLVAAYGSWMLVLKPYQKNRISSFINQNSDPWGSGYNLIQSKIAIGSGFLIGNGLGNGSQAGLGFLPEPHNDFVFAALAEQAGLLGAVFALGLVMIIVYRTLVIGSGTSANFGKLFSIGMAIFIFSHTFISSSVNIGLLPVTGLPFPFLSSGGSHLISLMAGLGILQSIKRYG